MEKRPGAVGPLSVDKDEEKWFDEDDEEVVSIPAEAIPADVEEEDPLDAFMASLNPELEKASSKKEEVVWRDEEDSTEVIEHIRKRRKELEDGSGEEEKSQEESSSDKVESKDDEDDDKGHVEISSSTLRKLIQGKKKAIGAAKQKAKAIPQIPEVESDEEELPPRLNDASGLVLSDGFNWEEMTQSRTRSTCLPSVAKSAFIYIEPQTITQTTFEEVARNRHNLNIQTAGINVPKLITTYQLLKIALSNWNVSPAWESCVALQSLDCPLMAPLECQYLPTVLSGRDCQITLRPIYEDGKLLSDGMNNFNPNSDTYFQAGYKPTIFCIYLTLIAMQAKLTAKQQEADLTQWIRSPLSIIVTSTDREASTLTTLIRSMDAKSQHEHHRLHIALILSQYDDPTLRDDIYKAPESDVLIGSATALVALLERGDVSFADAQLVMFVSREEGGLAFDSALASVILAQSADSRQLVLMNSCIDISVDQFVRDNFSRPVRMLIDVNQEVYRAVEGVQQRFMKFETETIKYEWVANTLGQFHPYGRTIIFCNSEERCSDLYALSPSSSLFLLTSNVDLTDTDKLGQKSAIITTTKLALRSLRTTSFACVINYDFPRSAFEFGLRAAFASPTALTPQTPSPTTGAARVYTLTLAGKSNKEAAYIAEAIARVEGRKKVPKILDDLAFAYPPYKASLLDAQPLPAERPSCPKQQSFTTKRRLQRRAIAPPAPPKVLPVAPVPIPPPAVPAAPAEEPGAFIPARNVVEEGVKVVSVIGLTVGPQLGKRKRRQTSSDTSSSSEEETDIPMRQETTTSVILDTAKLRARREANLAAFRAKRAAAKPQQPSITVPALPPIVTKGFSDAPIAQSSIGLTPSTPSAESFSAPLPNAGSLTAAIPNTGGFSATMQSAGGFSAALPTLGGFSELPPSLGGFSAVIPPPRGFSGVVPPPKGFNQVVPNSSGFSEA